MASMDDLQVGREEVPTDASAWARIWFLALARFHGAREPETWVFSEAEVVAFLRSKLRAGMPAWKRLKIVEGLMLYARQFPRVTRADLSPIRLTLMELATREGLIAEEILIEEVAGGRSRWRVENEAFKTLKNQGYQYEHNFGHGKENLCTVLMLLMFLAFTVDPIQQACCPVFIAVWAKLGSKRNLWDHLRSHVRHFVFESFEQLWRSILLETAMAQPPPR